MITQMKKITTYNPVIITGWKTSKYKQDANNCRLYAWLNNLRLNTKIITDADDFELYLKSFRIWPHWANVSYTAWQMLIRYFKEKNIEFYELDVLQDTKLFAELLLKWYSFIYSRRHNYDLLVDIMSDDDVDVVFKARGTRHAANICFKSKKITELWTRWESNRYNEFTYANVDLFIKCVKAGAIDSKVRFLDFKR